jgi:hypothetical protein
MVGLIQTLFNLFHVVRFLLPINLDRPFGNKPRSAWPVPNSPRVLLAPWRWFNQLKNPNTNPLVLPTRCCFILILTTGCFIFILTYRLYLPCLERLVLS